MKKHIVSFLAMGVLVFSLAGFAQVAGPGVDNGVPNFNGPNRFNITDQLRDQLVVPDDDVWKLLQPRIQKLINDEQIVRPAAGRGGRRFNANQPVASDATMDAVVQATAALNAILQNPTAAQEDVEAKGTALRQARQKALVQLQAEQKDLQGLLTIRQEMVLVAMGYLD